MTFVQITAASIVGNVLTLLVAYTMWRASKLERRGFSAKQLPLGLLVASLVPFGLVAWAALSLT